MYDNIKDSNVYKKEFPWPTRCVHEAGIAIIKEFEGLKLTAYQCPGKVWTIGYGHTRSVYPGMTISQEQAETLLQSDLEVVARVLTRFVIVPLNDFEHAALASFIFNVGERAFAQSTLLKLLNRGWYDQVPAQLMRWDKAKGQVLGGLSRRRAAEARLWNRTQNDYFDIMDKKKEN